MRSVWWQLGILGTISAFAYRHTETKKNLCRDGRSHINVLLMILRINSGSSLQTGLADWS